MILHDFTQWEQSHRWHWTWVLNGIGPESADGNGPGPPMALDQSLQMAMDQGSQWHWTRVLNSIGHGFPMALDQGSQWQWTRVLNGIGHGFPMAMDQGSQWQWTRVLNGIVVAQNSFFKMHCSYQGTCTAHAHLSLHMDYHPSPGLCDIS